MASRFEQFFQQADKDKSGFLSLDELRVVLKKNGYTEAKIEATFSTVDTSGDKKISLKEFLTAMGECSPEDHREAQIRAIFTSFDKNKDGTISSSELQAVLEETGKHLKPEEMKQLMAKIDKDGSGTITYEEFIKEVFGK
jgi:Ca2+-binding EF-hand superfamily protein